jgi:hypothetical protein
MEQCRDSMKVLPYTKADRPIIIESKARCLLPPVSDDFGSLTVLFPGSYPVLAGREFSAQTAN